MSLPRPRPLRELCPGSGDPPAHLDILTGTGTCAVCGRDGLRVTITAQTRDLEWTTPSGEVLKPRGLTVVGVAAVQFHRRLT